MGLRFRLSQSLACLALATGGCGGEKPNAASFVGHFVFSAGEVRGRCSGVSASQKLDGVEADLSQRSEGELVFTSGPRCQVPLEVEGATASAWAAAECDIGFRGSIASGVFESFRIEPAEAGLTLSATGTASVLVPIDMESEAGASRLLSCESFAMEGSLVKRGEQ